MANMKRKADHSENNQGSFHESSIPSNMFILVEDVFISTTIYRDRILVNVRRYKKHGEKYYPSKEGVTLTSYQFIHLVNSSFLREKLTEKKKDHPLYEYFLNLPRLVDPVTVHSDKSVGIQDKEKCYNIVMIEFDEAVLLKKITTCRNGNTFTKCISLNNDQWDKIFSLGDFLLDNLFHLKYNQLDFRKMFEDLLKHPAPSTAPEDDGTITKVLRHLLKTEIYKLLAYQTGLLNPMEVSPSELSSNTRVLFCESALNLKPHMFVKSFYNTVKNEMRHPVSQENLLNFVTARFLDTIDLVEILQIAKTDFCTSFD